MSTHFAEHAIQQIRNRPDNGATLIVIYNFTITGRELAQLQNQTTVEKPSRRKRRRPDNSSILSHILLTELNGGALTPLMQENALKDLREIYATVAHIATAYNQDVAVHGWKGRADDLGQTETLRDPDVSVVLAAQLFHDTDRNIESEITDIDEEAFEFYRYICGKLNISEDNPRKSATFSIWTVSPLELH